MSSAYHASLWDKVQTAGIYRFLQYKTRADAKVREAHRALHDKIFNIDDPVWQKIYPPNGWNCRCYTRPLTHEELQSSGANGERLPQAEPHTEQGSRQEAQIIKEADVSPDFQRNAAMTKSIWGKWSAQKFNDSNWTEIFKKTFEYDRSVGKYLKDNQLANILENNTAEQEYIEPTKENWNKLFPDNTVETVFGSGKFVDVKISGLKGKYSQYEKLIINGREGTKDNTPDGRHELMSLIKPTLQDPLMVIKDKYGGLVFIKSFKGEKGRIDFTSVGYKQGDIVEIVSSYERSRFESLMKKISSGEVLLFGLYSTPKNAGSFSRDTSPDKPATPDDSLNLRKNYKSCNELWGETIPGKKYNSILRAIQYFADGITISVSDSEKMSVGEKLKIVKTSYSEIDKYRRGVLIRG
jgi:hypothetical protein